MLALAARLMEKRLNADPSGAKRRTVPCHCGNPAHYAGTRQKTFITALGEMHLNRAYYHCQSYKSGLYPQDQDLDLERTSLSPAIHRMIGIAAARVSFAESSELLWELVGVRILHGGRDQQS